ncbi:MAG: Hpt domain-containing protein [Aquimonas sp.]|nr:Hpt domain-containing protein [Aquimonas sp.]
MRLQDDIDFTTLTWVKGELDETLKQARLALEAFVEDPDDASQMRFCATYLHQVQGTLRMVELYGAAMVTEEMEQLASALQNREVEALDKAYEVLMRGIVQLPDYLERLQSGHKDIPIVLLPLLNDLRAARGEKGLPESALFAPDLSQPLPASALGPAQPVPDLELRQQGAALRTQFQMALLRWFKGVDADANLGRMIDVCDRLVSMVSQEEGRRLFWVAGAVLFGVRSGEIEPSQQLKQTVGRVEREIKHLADAGDAGFRVDPPRELTRNLLYFVAHGRSNSTRLAEVRDAFRLEQFVPTQDELAEAVKGISGHNRALLDTVAGAIREDLLRVKDALDLYLRKADAQPAELSGQVDVLDRVGDTLGMLGLGVPRRVVMEQRDIVALVAQGQRLADESTLLDIAGALLYVEATLDDQVQQIGAPTAAAIGDETLPRAEARRVLEALVKEAQSNFAQAKQCFVAFIESNWDHAQLQDVPRLLGEVTGGMRMLDIPLAAELLEGTSQFTAVELVQHRRVPNAEQMDLLADALASIEYFIEALRDQRADRGKILELARERLASLGYWPVPDHALAPIEADIPVGQTDGPLAPAVAGSAQERELSARTDSGLQLDADVPTRPEVPSLTDLGAVEVAPGDGLEDLIVGSGESAPVQPGGAPQDLAGFKPAETARTAPPALGVQLQGFAIGGEEIDEEIREVFVEEVQEEIDNLRQLLPIWAASPEDLELLKPIRRVFHTLKGSGRLVGALVLGEFAWKIESMLNRVLGNSIPPRGEIVDLVGRARDALPSLLAALKGESGHYADLAGLQETAEALAAGHVQLYQPPAEPALEPAPEAAVSSIDLPNAGADEESDEAFEPSIEQIASVDDFLAAQAATTASDSEEGESADAEADALDGASLTFELPGVDVTDIEPMPLAAEREESESPAEPAQPAFELDELDLAETDDRPSIELAAREVEQDALPESLDLSAFELDEVAFDSSSADAVGQTDGAADELQGVEASELPALELEPLAAVQPDGLPELVLIDPDLFDILKGEVAGHLDTVEDYVRDSAVGAQQVQEPLLRAVHTINGAFAMTEVEVGTELAWPLEGYIKRLLAQGAAPSAVGLEAISDSAAALRTLMLELDQPMPRPPGFGRLAARVTALRDALPEPTAPVLATEIDEDALISAATVQIAATGPEAPSNTLDTQDAGQTDSEQPAVSADDFALAGASRFEDALSSEFAAIEPIGEGSEVSFASEFEGGESVDLEHHAMDPAFEIPETEAQAGPYWTSTEESPVLPAVSSGLTADELGDASEAEDWLARFEAEVAGESARSEAQSSLNTDEGALADAPADTQSVRLEDERAAMDDALLIESLLAEADGTPAPGVEALDAAADVARLLDGGTQSPTADEAETTADGAQLQPVVEGTDADASSHLSGEDAEIVDLAADEPMPAELATPEPTLEEQGFEVEPASSDDADALVEDNSGLQAMEPSDSPGSIALDDQVDALAASAADEDRVEEAALDHAAETADDDALVGVDADLEPALSAAAAAEPTVGELAVAVPTPQLDIPADVDPDAPLDVSDVDVELLDVFMEEGVDILDHSDSLMVRLRESPQDAELVVGLQRDLHTLKGGARMAGLAPIGDLAHATESLLEAVAAGSRDLGSTGVEVLERAFDRLHGMISRVGERRAIGMPVNLLASVEALLRGEALPSVAEVASMADIEADAGTRDKGQDASVDPAQDPAPTKQAPPPIRFIPTETALDEEDTQVRAPQEQIRIRADLLDRLVNYAGEVAIYRARLEQQLGSFRGNLGELDQTTTRLRDQLRKLEIETEAQILSRYQRQQDEGDTQFDPLELDRFSTLQQLSRALSESAADIVNLQTTLEDLTRQYETLLLQQSRVSSDLQEGLMRTRMVPFDSLVPRLRRILRQTAGELGKQAQLKVEGAQGEMDRNVLDRMTAPLEHMLRNAVAHGLETPEERISAGKSQEGSIRISVAREASEVLIRVADDGRGLDRDAIRRKAIERGLMKPDAQLGDRDLYGFILESGFSTATTVSKISGRGVGMDVVYSEIRQLGGSLHIESERGRGTEFVIRLPFTLAVTQAVFVKQGEISYAVPITSVQGVSRIDRADLDAQLASGQPSFSYAGEDYAIHDLGLLLGQPAAKASDSLQVPLLLARSGDQRSAICVDAVLGSREIVVKPTGPQVSSIPGIFGATIMGDGRVVVILDVAPLVRRAAAIEPQLPAPVASDQRAVPLVMVVDDSITMRKVTGRVLERHNLEVITAKDGVDAIEKLAERIPDVMLLDIEMPRMDGYELATHMRNDARLRGVPIIMITSRTGEKHRQRAFEIGVDRYLGKPYQEADLMRNVHEILQARRERGH